MTRRSRIFLPVALMLAGVSMLLTGCAATVALTPAPDAANPECAEIIVRLPQAVADQEIRETDAQGTAAWGTPSTVLLRCGVDPVEPTTLPCYNVNGIDWVEDDSDSPVFAYRTFGRTPATEIIIDSTKVAGGTALIDLANVMSVIPATAECTSVQDLNVPAN